MKTSTTAAGEAASATMTMRTCTTRRRFHLSVVILLISLATSCHGMVLKTPDQQKNPTKMASPPSPVASTTTTSDIISSNPLVSTLTDEQYKKDYYIPPNQLSQPVFHLGSSSSSSSSSTNKKSKSLNLFGLWCATMCLLTGVPWTAAMSAVDALVSDEQDPTKQLFDRTGKIWARAWLTLTNSMPELIGREHLLMTSNNDNHKNNAPSTPSTQPCLLVANHASWMDIPVLCAALEDHPPVFKFIAKRELTKVPGVGQQLVGGNHILIDRQDRRSQLQTFKESLQWLTKRHTSLVAFPEGQRSPDGRFQECKAGMVKLAMAAKVPIIPLSISHTHAVFPGYAWLPVQSGAGKLRVEIHEPIVFTETIVNPVDGSTSVTLTMTEDEIATAMERALRSGLPACQQPLEEEPEGNGSDDASKGSALPADAAP